VFRCIAAGWDETLEKTFWLTLAILDHRLQFGGVRM